MAIVIDETAQQHLDNLWSSDKDTQNTAFFALIDITDQSVAWTYAVLG